MEASSVVVQSNPCLSRGHTHRKSSSSSSKKKACMMMAVASSSSSSSFGLVRKGEDKTERFNNGYYDKGQLNYYYNNFNYGIKSKLEEKVKEEKKMIKKRLKLLKGLSKDLCMLSEMMGSEMGADHRPSPPSSMAADQGEAMSMSMLEAAQLLLGKLEKLRAEEKELKRKRKQEKALQRAAQSRNRVELDMSSSSSSESSGSECDGEEVVNMKSLKRASSPQVSSDANRPLIENEQLVTPTPGIMSSRTEQILPSSLACLENPTDGVCSSSSSLTEPECCRDGGSNGSSLNAVKKKIEVCMGGKCKKSGAATLIEEFQKAVGVDVAVKGCKCMGKCKDGPNVRLLNDDSIDGLEVDSVRMAPNSLCIGVGLEDVSLIVSNFFGENHNEFGLAAAP